MRHHRDLSSKADYGIEGRAFTRGLAWAGSLEPQPFQEAAGKMVNALLPGEIMEHRLETRPPILRYYLGYGFVGTHQDVDVRFRVGMSGKEYMPYVPVRKREVYVYGECPLVITPGERCAIIVTNKGDRPCRFRLRVFGVEGRQIS